MFDGWWGLLRFEGIGLTIAALWSVLSQTPPPPLGLDTEFVKYLGVASVTMSMLWLLLRQEKEERKEITARFFETLNTTIAVANANQVMISERLSDVAASQMALKAAIENYQQHADVGRAEIMKTLGAIKGG